jgi:putative membrane protein
MQAEGVEFTMMGGYGNGYYGGGGGGGGALGSILFFAFGLLVLVGIVLLIVWMVRMMSAQGHDTHSHSGPPAAPTQPPTKTDEACSIARKRYASGEITKEQFEEVCKALGV